jgi:hypothetical protein
MAAVSVQRVEKQDAARTIIELLAPQRNDRFAD